MKTKSHLLGMEGMRLKVLVRSRLEEEARLKEEEAKALRAKEKLEKRLGLTPTTEAAAVESLLVTENTSNSGPTPSL